MDATAVATVATMVMALTQLVKFWNILPDRWGPLSVAILAAIGVGVYGLSYIETFDRLIWWEYLAGWVAVAMSASGIYGFARARQPSDVTSMTAPPSGAGNHPTGSG